MGVNLSRGNSSVENKDITDPTTPLTIPKRPANDIVRKNKSIFEKSNEITGDVYGCKIIVGGDEVCNDSSGIYNMIQDDIGDFNAWDSIMHSYIEGGADSHEELDPSDAILNLDFFNGGETVPYRSLREYESSISAKLKEDVIRRLARALKNVGIDVNPDDDLDKIVKDMKRNIPNPNKGKTFASDANSHEKICKAVAEVLNEQFTPGAIKAHEKLIDPSIGPVETCRKVGEWIHSFNIGVNTEFLAVYASVQNAIRNILILDAIMERLYKSIEEKIKETGREVESETKVFREIYERSVAESTRQKELLKNILNVSLPPAMKEIELALQEESDQLSIIKRLNLKPGTPNFADSIAHTISAIGTTSLIAQKVNTALKSIGMSIDEYLASKDFQKFNKMLKSKYKDIKSGDLVSIIRAADILRKYFKDKDSTEFKKAIKYIGGSDMNFIYDYNDDTSSVSSYASSNIEGSGCPCINENVEGGTCPCLENVEGGEEIEGGKHPDYNQLSDLLYNIDKKDRMSEVELRLERVKKEKVIIVKDFIRRMGENYEEFNKVVNRIGRLFGSEIHITELTDKLRKMILQLRDIEALRIELALIGYYGDARARELKEQYINILKGIITICNDIMAHEMHKNVASHFKEFKDIMVEILTTVEIYSDALSKKISAYKEGGMEDVEGGVSAFPSDFNIRNYDIKLEEIMPEITKSQYNLNKGISDFLYFYYIGRVYKSLENASKETEDAGDIRYVETLGDAVANEIKKLYDNKAKALSKVTEDLCAEAVTAFNNANRDDNNDAYAPYIHITGNNSSLRELYNERTAKIPDNNPPSDIDNNSIQTQATVNNINQVIGRGEYVVGGASDLKDIVGLVNIADNQLRSTNNATNESIRSEMLSAIREHIEKDFDVKINFYRVIQAIDIYLKEFSVNITKRPEAVKNISKILDETQVIANWFNDETGEHIWKAYECMGTFRKEINGDEEVRNMLLHNPLNNDNKIPVIANSDQTEHYYDSIQSVFADNALIPSLAHPFVGVPCHAAPPTNRAKMCKSHISNAIDSFQALKNLLNAFIRIGDDFGGVELRRKVFMSPNQMYKYLIEYLKQSALFVNYGSAESFNPSTAIRRFVPEYYMAFSSATDSKYNNFTTENKYFAMIIKAMAAKILVVLGVYDMFDHRQSMDKYLDPIRMVLGGNDDDDVDGGALSKINNVVAIPEVAELYFRLPRLVEFYRKLLYWRGDTTGKRITMVPEIGGIFAGIIRLIFMKMYSPENGNYSDYDTKNVIYEINYIYRFYEKNRKGESILNSIILDFVKEINSKIGIIKGEDMIKFWQLQKKIETPATYGQVYNYDDTNYAILPEEGDFDNSGTAPSDRYFYRLKSDEPKKSIITKEIETTTNLELLNDFRNRIENIFSNVDFNSTNFDNMSYTNLIKEAEQEMKKHTNSENKLNVAIRLVQTTRELNIENDKAFIFNETVVAGLNALGSLYEFIENYRTFIKNVDPVELELKMFNNYFARKDNIIAENIMDAKYNLLVGDDEYLLKYTSIKDTYVKHRTFYTSAENMTRMDSDIYQVSRLLESVKGNVNGMTMENIKSDYKNNEIISSNTNDPNQRAYIQWRCVFRYMVNYQLIMKHFIENLFGITNGELIKVKFISNSTSPIQFDFSNLVATVEGLISEIKYYINIFRPFLTREVIDRFESAKDPEKTGSIYWFERKFIDELFRGVNAGNNENLNYEANSLNELFTVTNKVFTNLTRNTGVSVFGVVIEELTENNISDVFTESCAVNKNSPYVYEIYGDMLAELIFYNNTTKNKNINVGELIPNAGNAGIRARSKDFNKFIMIDRVLTKATDIGGLVEEDPANQYQTRVMYWEKNNIIEQKSLLFAFNQLLSVYLHLCMDQFSNKIYAGLINQFANGIASQAIFNPQKAAFPDLSRSANITLDIGDDVNRMYQPDPKPESIVLQSLAFVVLHCISDVNPRTSVPDYLINTLTDVPVYMKERYKNTLTYISKLFETLIDKAEFIKTIIQKTKINCTRGRQVYADENIRYTGIEETEAFTDFTNAFKNSDIASIEFSQLIESIIEHSYSIKSMATDTLQELGTSNPRYFEVYNNFIDTYRQRYDKYPLMPLSYALYAVRDIPEFDTKSVVYERVGGRNGRSFKYKQDKLFYPNEITGSIGYKFQCGIKPIILNTTVSYDDYPSIKEMILRYNSTSIRSDAIELDKYQDFMKYMISIIRYNIQCRNFKSYVQSDIILPAIFNPAERDQTAYYNANFTQNPRKQYSIVNQFDKNTIYKPQDKMISWAYDKNCKMESVIFAIESSNQDDIMSNIISKITKVSDKEASRLSECVNNIIDLNIMPININVLMKEIPLINLYNYDFTFELMASRLYGKKHSKFKTNSFNFDDVGDTQDALLGLLFHPYLNVDGNIGIGFVNDRESESYEFINRIMRGDNNLGLGRPKFLSDQLFNKVLLKSIYPAINTYDEAGPVASVNMFKGFATTPANPFLEPKHVLTYPIIDNENNFKLKQCVVTDIQMRQISVIGKRRFDTSFIRNLFLIVNVLRVTRLKLNRELTNNRNVVVNSHYAVAPSITEYGVDPFNPNEIYKSKTVDNQYRFNSYDYRYKEENDN